VPENKVHTSVCRVDLTKSRTAHTTRFGGPSSVLAFCVGLRYRGTTLNRKRTPLGPYRRPMPRVLGGSYGGGCFLMGEVPLYVVRNPRPAHRPRFADLVE